MIDEARRQICVLLTFLLLFDGLEELLVYFLFLPEHGCKLKTLSRAAVRRGLGEDYRGKDGFRLIVTLTLRPRLRLRSPLWQNPRLSHI